MRTCHTTDDRLFAFVDGVELADVQDLDAHVATCDECQAFLAEVWEGELGHDLREPVIRRIRFDQFLSEMVGLGVNIVSAMGRATAEYTFGTDAGDNRHEAARDDPGLGEDEPGDPTP